MSIEDTFGSLFKPEVKTSGHKLVAQEKLSLSNKSDTAIQAYARVAPPAKVTLTSEDISSNSFAADCTCPVAKKDRFCKHIWATLICVEQDYPDFLSEKINIEKGSAPEGSKAEKQRTSDYRKDQYQKHKLHQKERKREKNRLGNANASPTYPEEVEVAISYFAKNGFSMTDGPSRETLAEAKRTLSRVFHPDKGGSHEESVELNSNCEVLLRFFRT